jgi:hypothetical protein
MVRASRRAVLALGGLAAATRPSLRLSALPSSPLVGESVTFTYSGLKGNATYHPPQASGWTFQATSNAKVWRSIAPPPAGEVVVSGSATQKGITVGATIQIQVRSPGVASLDQSPIDPLNLRDTAVPSLGMALARSDTLALTDTASVSLVGGAMLLGCSPRLMTTVALKSGTAGAPMTRVRFTPT